MCEGALLRYNRRIKNATGPYSCGVFSYRWTSINRAPPQGKGSGGYFNCHSPASIPFISSLRLSPVGNVTFSAGQAGQ